MSQVIINDKAYIGKQISITKNGIIVDGEVVHCDDKKINIQVNGNIDSLDVSACDKISVYGEVGKIKTQSGDVRVKGPVAGDVKTMSGDVTCGNVSGKVKTMSGDITKR